MSYFARLGASLERRWLAVDRDEEAFADLAMAALEEMPPLEGFDRSAFLDRALDPLAPTTPQLAPTGAFGQPGVTVYHGRGFVVDVYYWLSSLSAIHNHPFCGAFTVLEGFSVHARYGFSASERVGPRVQLGDVRLEGLELLEAGDRRAFSLERHPLVHALIHVPVPSLSMVVRTIRTEGYWRYFPPTVAMAMSEPDDAVARQLALLESLRQAGEPSFPERLARYLGDADFEAAFLALARLWADCEPADREALLEALRPRHGDRVDAIAPALSAAFRFHAADAIREAVRDPEQRLAATALMYAESRPQVLELVGRRADDPVATLHALVDAVEEGPTAVASHALVEGADADGAARRLVESGIAAEAIDRPSLEAHCRSSPFAVLGRGA